LWECEIEMIRKMFEIEELWQGVQGKTVAEIGCGHGLLAVSAHKLNAKKLVLQDYNQEVIEQLTKPTLALNSVDCPL
jgi:predicted RNA methylase